MKEATLTSAHVAETFQSVIDWNALKSNVAILGLIAMIAEYLIIGLVVFIIGCEFYCLGKFIWNKLRFLFKR